MQLSFFSSDPPPPDPIIGVSVLVQGRHLFFGGYRARQGSTRTRCESHRREIPGWVSKATAEFIRETVRAFDAEGEPLTVTLRHKRKET